MRGVGVIVFFLLATPFQSAPIGSRRDNDSSDPPPLTTSAPPPLMPTVPANQHGILIWMCQNSNVLQIIDEIKQSDFDVTDVANLTKEVYRRLIDYSPGRLWTVYSTLFTTRSTANLIAEDGQSTTASLCFVQFSENPQILVVADLAEVI